MNVLDLLRKYKNIRDAEIPKLGPHRIEKSIPYSGGIMTFEPGFSRPISPMLKKRFEFCSTWENAYLSQKWLSIDEINNWENDEKINEWVNLRKENSYDGDPLEDYPMRNLAIFAINPYEPEEIYLVWDEGRLEPRVWHYVGAEFYRFNSFRRFLLYINGMMEDTDTVREVI
ncbi:hypothetical protein [Delftia acidovorans]|uniref:hypothetical protein n=1 Tax=Delftia acidovorans TaxID=80866 RepID=UPI003D0B954C